MTWTLSRLPLSSGLAHAAAAVALAALNACTLHCDHRNECDEQLRAVPVPPEWTAGSGASAAGSEEGDSAALRRQTYTIDDDGLFTFSRSYEEEVGRIGIGLRELDEKAAKRLKTEPFSGVRVGDVIKGSSASRAGICADDVIQSFGDAPVRSVEQLKHLVAKTKPGATVPVQVFRSGNTTRLEVEVEAERVIRDAQSFQRRLPVSDDRDRSGLKLVEISAEAAPMVLGPTSPSGGVVVLSVLPGGPAFYSPLRAGDQLAELAGKPLANMADYETALGAHESGDSIAFLARRRGSELKGELVLDDDATAESELNIIVFERKSAPHRSKFSLVAGILFHWGRCRSIEKHGQHLDHEVATEWGMLLDFIHYKSGTDHADFQLGWIIPPVKFKKDT